MHKGIFNKRLYYKRKNFCILIHIIINDNLRMYPVSKSVILYFQIIFYKLDFRFKSDLFVAYLNISSHYLCKHLYKFLYFRLFVYLCLHSYGFECVVKEMRIYLTGKHLKFHFSLFRMNLFFLNLFLNNFLHKFTIVIPHLFDFLIKFSNLVSPLNRRNLIIFSNSNIMHLFTQKFHSI